jgi:MFS family permease
MGNSSFELWLLTVTPGPMQAKTEIRPGETAVHADANRTLAVTAAGTLLVLAVFMAAVTTARQSSDSLHGGLSGQTWILSGMSLGLAAALLTVGARADDLGRRRILVLSSALLALASALGAVAPS